MGARAPSLAAVLLVACSSAPPAPVGDTSVDCAVDAVTDAVTPDAPDVTAPADAPLPRRDFDVSAGDVTLHVWTVGGTDGGPLLVLLNGGPGLSHDYLEAFERYASAGLRVASFDQRGCGRSTPARPEGFSFDDHVRDLEAVRVALGAESLHVMGHSWGGGYALAYAAAHPDRVASLALVDTVPPADADALAGVARFEARTRALQMAGRVPATLPRPTDDDCRAYDLALFPVYLADPALPVPPEVVRTASRCSTRAAAIDATAGYDLTADLARVTAPTVVIFGASDPFGLDWQARTVAALPAASPSQVSIDGAGHYPWFERPSQFDAALRAFLAGRVGLPLGEGLRGGS